MTHEQISNGTHFWAILDKKLCMIGKFRDEYFVCDEWECPVDFEEIKFIEAVRFPEGYTVKDLYY